MAFAIYAIGAFALTSNAWRAPAAVVTGTRGDSLEYVWSLAWPPYAVSHLQNPFFTSFLNAPWGANLMWYTPPLPGLVMWPVTAIWGPVVSYNVLAILAFAGSGACMFVAARAITHSATGAFAAGLLYAFSPYMIAHGSVGHLVLLLAFGPPLLLLLGYDALVRRKWKRMWVGLGIGSLLALQYMTFPELLATSIVGGLVVVAWLALLNPRRITRPLLQATALVGAFAAAAAAVWSIPAALTMFAGPQRLQGGTVHGIDTVFIDVANFVVPTPYQRLAPTAAQHLTTGLTDFYWETSAYLGIPMLVLLVAALIVLRRRRSIWVLGAALATVAVLSLGAELRIGGHDLGFHLPWLIADHIPIVQNLIPARLTLILYMLAALMLAMLIAHTVRDLSAEGHRRRTMTLLAMGLAVSAVSLMPGSAYPVSSVSVPAFFARSTAARISEGSTVLILPYVVDGKQVEGELWQVSADFRFKIPEGYAFTPGPSGPVTGPTPTVFGGVLTVTQDGCTGDDIDGNVGDSIKTQLRAWIDARCDVSTINEVTLSSYRSQIRDWQVDAVVLGPAAHQDELSALITRVTGMPPESSGGVLVWWNAR